MRTTNKPRLQEFHIEGVKHVDPLEVIEALKNNDAVLIDVREEYEVKLEYVPLDNVLNHPLSVIMDGLPFIAKDQNIILACPGGVRSSKVANLLNLQGYPSVANLDGGLTMWKARGLPFESDLSVGLSCGCGYSPASDKEQNGCC